MNVEEDTTNATLSIRPSETIHKRESSDFYEQ